MSLTDYSRKRRFSKTPEPPPAEPHAQGNRFCVQRHSATRLHYDLRLEVGGALKSWAVPKGPTLDPKEKRLAVHVEDHPIEYGDFEGTIPAGNYGAGSVLLWDRGTYELLGDVSAEKQLERGDFKFRLHGEKLMGEFALVKIKGSRKDSKGNEWLLLKKPDFAAKPGWDSENDLRSVKGGSTDLSQIPGAVKAKMPTSLKPMMANSSSSVPKEPDWIFEVKWDGVRGLCFVDGKNLDVIGRSGLRMVENYPEFNSVPASLSAKQVILDGEVVAFDSQGRPSFADIQPRIAANRQNVNARMKTNPVTFFAFDLLYLDGYDLRAVPLLERKRLLASIIRPNSFMRVSDHFTDGSQLLAAAQAQGLEGIVAKVATSTYESKRSAAWVKIKIVSQQDFLICGYTSGERDHFGSLALGVYEDGKLEYSGNVGSGFNSETLSTMEKKLQKLEVAKSPFSPVPKIPGKTTWVKPELICVVKFNHWTRDHRLRAPVFIGMRNDISPKDVIRETETAVAEEATPVARPQLLPPDKAEVILTVEGKPLKFTNLNKVFYPREKYSKRDVINYYDAVSGLILPYLKDRPLSLKRYPNGIDSEFFFQKDAAKSFPDWLRTENIQSEKKTINYVICNDRATLLYLANLACIDQNPWMSRVGSLENPDFMLIDLDPYHCEYDRIVEAAQLVREKLAMMGLQGFPKTTGGDGMHIYVPLDPVYNYEQVRSFAEIIARMVAGERPDLFTTPRTVAKREKGKVYYDYMQVREGSTISAPYVLRAYPGAPVSTPLRWSEVTRGLSPQQFDIRNSPDRFARLGNLFAQVLTLKQRLETAIGMIERMVAGKTK